MINVIQDVDASKQREHAAVVAHAMVTVKRMKKIKNKKREPSQYM